MHITEAHCELAGLRAEVLETILGPERILTGGDGELIAIRELEQGNISQWSIGKRRMTALSSPLL
jgi:hypothetical protein